MSAEWKEVTREAPCPACGKPNYCAWATDSGMLKCERTATPPPGMRLVKAKDGGALFAHEDGARGSGREWRSAPSQTRPSPKEQPTRDWEAEAERCASALSDEQLDTLARDLGVRGEALRALRAGWATKAELRRLNAGGKGWKENRPEGAYTFPERNGAGQVVGLSLRAPDGRKGFPRGGQRGIVVPDGLSELPGSALVLEGASDVAAALSIGLAAVGRPSNSGGVDDLAELLRDREVLVLGENDEKEDGRWPGRDGALGVAEGLARQRREVVRWSLPPGEAKDARDWLRDRIEGGLDLDDDAARRAAGADLLAGLSEAAIPVQPPPAQPTWNPYPLDALPLSIRELAREGAVAIGCDPSDIALPAVVVCAGAIGLSHQVKVKNGWPEPSVLWGCVVSESGTTKSPALDLAEAPLAGREAAARRKNRRERRNWEERCEVRKAQAKRGEKPDLPDPPVEKRHLIKDATIEAVGSILEANPQGVTVVRDELSAWFRSWGEYKQGKDSGDSAKWIELYGARGVSVDRANATRRVYVERGGASVCGGTQPGVLRRVLSLEHLESGCAARILFSVPPRKLRVWTEEEVQPSTTARYASVVNDLLELEPRPVEHEDGEEGIAPKDILPTAEARDLFRAWVNGFGRERFRCSGHEAAAAAKIEGVAARLALVIELVTAAEQGRAGEVTEIGAPAMKAGIRLARWHWNEARRVLALLRGGTAEAETAEDRARRELIEWIAARGGETTTTELVKGPRRFRGKGGADRATGELREFVDAGIGVWIVEGGRPGRPCRRFRLLPDEGGGGRAEKASAHPRRSGGGGRTPPDDPVREGFTANRQPPPLEKCGRTTTPGEEEECVWTE